MKILAVTLEKCSGCAVFIDDKIVFSASEERYTNIKSDSSFPQNCILDGLKFCGLDAKDLDQVLICGNKISLIPSVTNEYSNVSVDEQLRIMREYWYPNLVEKKNKSFLEVIKNRINLEQFPFNTELGKNFDYTKLENPYTDEDGKNVSEFFKNILADFLKVDIEKISHVEHDDCHASYGFYGSPLRDDNTIILTADGWGDDLSGTISLYSESEKKINRVIEYDPKQFQLARMYRYTTLVLRMLANEHEYKVMGLASYYNGPNIEKVEKVFDEMLQYHNLEFSFNPEIPDIYDHLEKKLENFRFDHIAAGLQSFTEKILVNWFSDAVERYDSTSAVFSGGVSMNVKANMKISEIPKIKKFFVCGAGTDETLPIGACYHYAEINGISPKKLENLYLGSNPEYPKKDVTGLSHYSVTDFTSEDQILEKILENKIVAVCKGRMEMGQRALGNRSIIADARKLSNVEKINNSIKKRDFWMPFAPIILSEYQDILIENPKKIESPFMTIGFPTKEGKTVFPAGVHQSDGTARAQLLKKEDNPTMWNLIFKFYEKTGVPALLNTSFNLHGEPIVRTVKDALRVFEKSELEVLWLENHIIEKNS